MTKYLLILLQLLFFTGLLWLPLIYLWSKERRFSRSLAQSNRLPPKSIRIVEVSILLVITAMLVLQIASGGIGMASPPLPTALYLQRGIICAVLVGLASLWGLVGIRGRVALGTAGMLLCVLIGFLFISSANLLSYERFEQQIREIPLPVEIRLNEQIDDVDVIINGVNLGKVPLQTTMEEILAKAPVPIDKPPGKSPAMEESGWRYLHASPEDHGGSGERHPFWIRRPKVDVTLDAVRTVGAAAPGEWQHLLFQWIANIWHDSAGADSLQCHDGSLGSGAFPAVAESRTG